MGFGDKKKGKGNGDDDLPKGLRRKPGEDISKRLEEKAAERSLCPKCHGAKGKQEIQYAQGKGKTTEIKQWVPCNMCGARGFVQGTTR